MTISTEQFLAINIGSSPNDGTGDALRAAFTKINNNFTNISDIGFDAGNVNVQGSIEVAGNVKVGSSYVPTTSTSPGIKGQITFNSTYVYVCVATNSWKRLTLASW